MTEKKCTSLNKACYLKRCHTRLLFTIWVMKSRGTSIYKLCELYVNTPSKLFYQRLNFCLQIYEMGAHSSSFFFFTKHIKSIKAIYSTFIPCWTQIQSIYTMKIYASYFTPLLRLSIYKMLECWHYQSIFLSVLLLAPSLFFTFLVTVPYIHELIVQYDIYKYDVILFLLKSFICTSLFSPPSTPSPYIQSKALVPARSLRNTNLYLRFSGR
jgi:hypothetical protein